MAEEKPDMNEALKRFSESLTPSLARTGQLWRAQGALGWMLRGDIEKARDTLESLPADRLPEIAVAATTLVSLAEEIAAHHPTHPEGDTTS
ncbi:MULTISPECIES: hypothetical protein [Nocardia]|uniref:hypothetical protein n=1 Tax=Nocardia TaxID=1817 RepID=UPI0015EF88C9|nr:MULTISPECIES: hypothetical protein [Nocardia]